MHSSFKTVGLYDEPMIGIRNRRFAGADYYINPPTIIAIVEVKNHFSRSNCRCQKKTLRCHRNTCAVYCYFQLSMHSSYPAGSRQAEGLSNMIYIVGLPMPVSDSDRHGKSMVHVIPR
jgi:hypothetical protein